MDSYLLLWNVIGLLTGVGTEKLYENYGKMTKMIIIEISVDGYVDEVNGFIADGSLNWPVVALQFAKVKSFKGKIDIQNVLYASRLLFNPDIAEAISMGGPYRIKLRVSDNVEKAVFVIFDRDGYYMLKKSCPDMVYEIKKPGATSNYPRVGCLGREDSIIQG